MEIFIVLCECSFTLVAAYLALYATLRLMADIVIPNMNDIPVRYEMKKVLFWYTVMLLCIALAYTFSKCHGYTKPYNLIDLINQL